MKPSHPIQHPSPLPEPPRPPDQLQWPGHITVGSVATSGPEPKATLTATAQWIELQGTLGRFRFTPQTIERLHRAGLYPWFWGGIRIRHRVAEYPNLLQFCPIGARSRQILDALKALGYPTT